MRKLAVPDSSPSEALASLLARGMDHWLVMFSGGKDSTAMLVTVLETVLQEELPVRRIDVVYTDTLVEIAPIRDFALSFIEFLKSFERVNGLPVHFHVVSPSLDDRFWTCLLGKGYPPPHQRFRWCTKRLKIRPVQALIRKAIKPKAGRAVILTGVRFDESSERNKRLNVSCRRGGECGQGMWFQYRSRLQIGYAAPIVSWKECMVWDFLNFQATKLGYPTDVLEREVYLDHETRFGCWTCTVVRQDRTMEGIVSQKKWEYLWPLLDFRNHLVRVSQLPGARYIRPDGHKGRLTIEIRQQLFDKLLDVQKATGVPIISDHEREHIQTLWNNTTYQDYGEGKGT